MNTNTDALTSITAALQNDGVAVVRTDTIYGIIALASSRVAVEKVYTVKRRNPAKQCIVLVTKPEDVPVYAQYIKQYSLDSELPTSVVVPASDEPEWLLRGGDAIAYRVVRDPFLRRVVETVGPVIAPSANPEGEPPARTIEEAERYFGRLVDAYIDGGEVPETVQASQIIQVQADGTVRSIRS